MKQNQIAIVVPCYKVQLSASERIAWRRILEVYGHLPIIMMAPPWLDTTGYIAEHPSLKVERFEFRTVRDYSQLLLQSAFYDRFTDYEHILIYQLDCYILRDDLLSWCDRGFHYIGAPLFREFEPPEPEGKLWRVGNGGLSLRNVEAARKVLNSKRRYQTPLQHLIQNAPKPGVCGRLKWLVELPLKLTRFHNDVHWATLSNFNEDIFWSLEAPHFWPGFKLPDLSVGLEFAFDYAPAYCYKQTGQLPFGCHAWPRYDLAFWKQFIPEATALPS